MKGDKERWILNEGEEECESMKDRGLAKSMHGELHLVIHRGFSDSQPKQSEWVSR